MVKSKVKIARWGNVILCTLTHLFSSEWPKNKTLAHGVISWRHVTLWNDIMTATQRCHLCKKTIKWNDAWGAWRLVDFQVLTSLNTNFWTPLPGWTSGLLLTSFPPLNSTTVGNCLDQDDVSIPYLENRILGVSKDFLTETVYRNLIFEHTYASTQWAHMHRFLSICLSLDQNSLDQNSYLRKYHIKGDEIWYGNVSGWYLGRPWRLKVIGSRSKIYPLRLDSKRLMWRFPIGAFSVCISFKVVVHYNGWGYPDSFFSLECIQMGNSLGRRGAVNEQCKF